MQVLTPTGYKHPSSLSNGDEVCAFDENNTGIAIINEVEDISFVDYAEWCRWWQVEDTVPPFTWYRINGGAPQFREQSIWRNGSNVCHVRDLVVGDVVYDDHDRDVLITSIDLVEDNSLVWYRFDISGDRSYIVDGLTVHNATKFWVGGAGTWDSSTTTHWAVTSNGAGGTSVPGSADSVTFDASSGGGTVTLNFGGTITIQSFAGGTHTGTFDNSVNNNNMTLSQTNGFNSSGTGVRTVKLGTATYTLTASAGQWNFLTTNSLTFTGNTGANIVFSATVGGVKVFAGGGLSHGNVTLGTAGAGLFQITGANTIASLAITAPNYVQWANGVVNTITAAVAWAGSAGSQIGFISNSSGTTATIALAAGSTARWLALRDIAFTGSPVSHNSSDLGNNSGTTINAPNTTRSRIQSGF